MAESTILQAARIIARDRQHALEVDARRLGRKKYKSTEPRLFSDRLDWHDRIDELGLPPVAQKLVREHSARVDISPKATEARANAFVDALCSGQRCSLTRSYKIAGFGKHNPGLDALLERKGVRDRFAYHAWAGHPLPIKYKDRILQALGIDPAELRETLELLGLAEP